MTIAPTLRARENEMPSTCEDAGHQPKDDDKTVREYTIYDDEAGDSFPRWLCDSCANEAEECGVRMKGVEQAR
jgi:hypothetical protein